MSSEAPIKDPLPIYGDDEDDDGIKTPKYLSNLIYDEILTTAVEVSLLLVVDVDNTHPHLFDRELSFVDFAIRKVLIDDGFSVWDVEVESHYVTNVRLHPIFDHMFECDYNGIFSVGLQVNKYDTDVLGLKEEMRVSLLTAMNTGKFNRALHDSYQIQKDSIIRVVGERVEGFGLLSMNVYRNEFKVSTIISQPTPQLPQDDIYYDFLQKDEDSDPEVKVITDHRFTHTYVAMTVFALTVLCLFLNYGCFMTRMCRRVKAKKQGNVSMSEDDSMRDTAHHHDVEIVLNKVSNLSLQHHLQQEITEHDASALDDIVEVDIENENDVPSVMNYNNTDTIAF